MQHLYTSKKKSAQRIMPDHSHTERENVKTIKAKGGVLRTKLAKIATQKSRSDVLSQCLIL